MERDVLKSDTCSMSIPELELEVGPGALAGRFTTVEGLLTATRDQLKVSLRKCFLITSFPKFSHILRLFFIIVSRIFLLMGMFHRLGIQSHVTSIIPRTGKINLKAIHLGIKTAVQASVFQEQGRFLLGDSADREENEAMRKFLDNFESIMKLEKKVHIVLDDPTGNSYVQVSVSLKNGKVTIFSYSPFLALIR